MKIFKLSNLQCNQEVTITYQKLRMNIRFFLFLQSKYFSSVRETDIFIQNNLFI